MSNEEFDGVTAIESSVGPLELSTTRLVVVLCVRLPLVPVMVNVNVPVGVAGAVVTVIVEVPAPGTDVGLNAAVAPAGNPLTENVTAPLNPFTAATAGVYVVLAPWMTDREAGEFDMVKSGVTDTPVPVSARVSGLAGSLLVMITDPVRAPGAVGVKVTPNEQVADVAMGALVQVLEAKAKSPVAVMLEMASGVTPTLVTVMAEAALVAPTFWFPKFREVGETETPEAATALSLNSAWISVADSARLYSWKSSIWPPENDVVPARENR